ncbi:hypothetical protein JCM11641_008150 [Rhodosporidiobolus odoratus]
MEQYLISTKPSTSRSQPFKPAAGKPKPYSSLAHASSVSLRSPEKDGKRRGASANPLQGGIERANNAIVKTLAAEDNPITKSTAYSRTLHVQSCASGHQSGGGGARWTKHRNQKLREQAADTETTTLRGVTAYISGYTGKDITNMQLKVLIEMQGGVVKTVGSAKVTHIFITNNLSGSKAQKALEAKKHNGSKLVTPEWAVECARTGRRVSEARFQAPIFNEVQGSTYNIFASAGRDSASPSDASTSSSSSSVSPPIASTSSGFPFPPASSSNASTSPRLRSSTSTNKPPAPVAPTKTPTSATALLLAQIDATKAALPPSPPRPKNRHKKHAATCESAADVFAPTQAYVPYVKPEVEAEPVKVKLGGRCREWSGEIVLGSSDVEGEGEGEDKLDEWGMPPSGQRR